MSGDDGSELGENFDSSTVQASSDSTDTNKKRARSVDDSLDGAYDLLECEFVDYSSFPTLVDSTNASERARWGDSRDGAYDKSSELGAVFELMDRTSLVKCMTLSTSPRDEISAKVENMLVKMSKKYLQYFKVPESRIADIVKSIYPDAVGCSWLLENDWHDQAYNELLYIRNMHSYLLDEVYNNRDARPFKSKNHAFEHGRLLRRLANFLGKSRDEIGALSKEEFYDRMMEIKCVVAYHAKQDGNELQQQASIEDSGEKLANWRDQTYELIRSFRKTYSCKLDDAYMYVHGGQTEGNVLTQYKERCLRFLQEALDFLGNSRADIVFLSKNTCCGHLSNIKGFVTDSQFYQRRLYMALHTSLRFSSNCQNQQDSSSSPNWRDLAYEELQTTKDRVVLNDFRRGHLVWSETPELHELVEVLGECYEGVVKFLAMKRSAMALLSEDEHARQVKVTTRDLTRMHNLMGSLQVMHPISILAHRPL